MKRYFTVGKVDVFGNFVPGAVVEVADLLFVLHHVGRLASFFVLHRNVILDCLKIFAMLERGVMERMQRSQLFFHFVCTSDGFFFFYLVEPLKEAIFVLGAPRLPLSTGSLLVTGLLVFISGPLTLGCLGHSSCGASHRPRLSDTSMGRRAVLCPCVTYKKREANKKTFERKLHVKQDFLWWTPHGLGKRTETSTQTKGCAALLHI